MSHTTLSTQGLVPSLATTISIVHLISSQCDSILTVLNLGSGTKVLGVALRLSKKGAIELVALATPTVVFLINIDKAAPQSNTDLARVLENPHCLLAGFSMARLALILNRKVDAHVYGVDLSTLHSPSNRKPLSAAELVSKRLNHCAKRHDIHALWLRKTNNDVCLRAWLAASIAEEGINKIKIARKVDTRHLRPHQLACLSQVVLNAELLDAVKPTAVDNDFEGIEIGADGKAVLHNARFKTRARASKQTLVEINDGQVRAMAVSTNGKRTGLVLQGKLPSQVNKVRVIGREEATQAELSRDEFLLRVLQGSLSFPHAPFVQLLWFPVGGKAAKNARRKAALGARDAVDLASFENLNGSQRTVVHAMISEGQPLVIAHGPPGTGKTTTIAAALEYWQVHRKPTWVIAQSNVGVKNIARSLIKKNIDFKIIVSKEFHFEWHEHLYTTIEDRLIRTDEFGDGFDAKRQIGETKIILCTLSMLSNPSLELYGVFQHVPVERLVVDEASQIDTFEFMHLFHQFHEKLDKVCMFGDPKQLPPYGIEAAPKMKTIFDFKHLQRSAYFLDTQYRMPVPLGEFISKAVYDSKLRSVHDIKGSGCVLFVDVRKGKEERMGSSWKNTEEVHTIVNIVSKYYRHEKFCIITPYDAQRQVITDALKKANLPHDQVYNVDSFQGHEAPYVLVSPVRTSLPGFLRSQNRMNVMLTRCQAGMVLVTQRAFLRAAGQDTLLGRLAAQWERRVGASVAWADAMRVADGTARLPGVGALRKRGEGAQAGAADSATAGADGLVGYMDALFLVD